MQSFNIQSTIQETSSKPDRDTDGDKASRSYIDIESNQQSKPQTHIVTNTLEKRNKNTNKPLLYL